MFTVQKNVYICITKRSNNKKSKIMQLYLKKSIDKNNVVSYVIMQKSRLEVGFLEIEVTGIKYPDYIKAKSVLVMTLLTNKQK
jgi:hypothetical protein